MSDTFIRRIPLDMTRELLPQLAELTEDPDPEIARWAAENLLRELEHTKFSAWLARRAVEPGRRALEEQALFEQYLQERRPRLKLVHSR
jgi:hypothetical protein